MLIQNKTKLIVSSAIIVICLILAIIFPAQSGFQTMTKEIFFLIIVPFLYIKYVLQEKISLYGATLGDKKSGILWGISMFAAALAISYLLVQYTDLKYNYNIPFFIAEKFSLFLVYELIFINILILTYECFFRGFVLFTFAPRLGYWAVTIPIIIYWAMIIATNSLSWNITPAAILTVTSSITAYKSRSFVYSYASGLIYIILFHSYLIYLSR